MTFWHSIRIALDNLKANQLRSLLTMLGIIIGVSAVIMMVGILQGASSRITKEFQKMGSNLIFVAFAPDFEERKKMTHHISGLKMEDVEFLKRQCSYVKSIAPEMPIGNSSAKFGGFDTDVTPMGILPEFERMRNTHVNEGRFISDEDIRTWAKVCVIGDKVRLELFKNTSPIGKIIEINGLNLEIVGVTAPKGRTFEGDFDKNVFLPLSTVQKRILGQDTVGVIYAEAVDMQHMDQAKDQIWQALMSRYNNLPGWKVDSFDNILNSINQVLAIFTLVMGSIAGLALLVGGIGIMNIMLVSVTERTKEIGLRKAIGAKRKDILMQFLVESATLSGVGGLMGVGIGTSVAYLIGFITTFIPQLVNERSGERGIAMYVPPWVMIGAFAFSAFVGVFFGVYPAIRASMLDPIDALRHE